MCTLVQTFAPDVVLDNYHPSISFLCLPSTKYALILQSKHTCVPSRSCSSAVTWSRMSLLPSTMICMSSSFHTISVCSTWGIFGLGHCLQICLSMVDFLGSVANAEFDIPLRLEPRILKLLLAHSFPVNRSLMPLCWQVLWVDQCHDSAQLVLPKLYFCHQ